MTSITGTTQPDTTPTAPPAQTPVILGVDTHRDTHVAAVLTEPGAVLATKDFPATPAGYTALHAWAASHGTLTTAGIEGTGSYGAALTRHLVGTGVTVIEVNRPDRAARRRHGKNDTVDAIAAARSVIDGKATATPKTGDGHAEALRLYKTCKDSAVKARTTAINQLRADLISADPHLRQHLTNLTRATLIRTCATLPDTPAPASPAHAATVITLRTLARRIQALTAEINDLTSRITAAVKACAPALLERPGIGPDSAAALLIAAGDNPDRIATPAAYAALCGASPVEHSSGLHHHHRLNRGGDRQANAALYRIAQTRLRWDPATADYLARRTAQGKTRRAIIRCLKRYIAREVFNLIRQAATTTATTTT